MVPRLVTTALRPALSKVAPLPRHSRYRRSRLVTLRKGEGLLRDPETFAGLQCARVKVVRIGDPVDDLLHVGAWAGVGGSEPPERVARLDDDGGVTLRRRCVETDAR